MREIIAKSKEKAATWIVWRLPRWMIYWAVIRAATLDEKDNPSEVKALTMLKRFEVPA